METQQQQIRHTMVQQDDSYARIRGDAALKTKELEMELRALRDSLHRVANDMYSMCTDQITQEHEAFLKKVDAQEAVAYQFESAIPKKRELQKLKEQLGKLRVPTLLKESREEAKEEDEEEGEWEG